METENDQNRRPSSDNPGELEKLGLEKGEVASSESSRNSVSHGFSGPDDPDNAMNWGIWKKIYNTSVPALMCLAV